MYFMWDNIVKYMKGRKTGHKCVGKTEITYKNMYICIYILQNVNSVWTKIHKISFSLSNLNVLWLVPSFSYST